MATYVKVVFPQRFPKQVSDVFDYVIPDALIEKIRPGSGVKVPFRNSQKVGIVLALDSTTAVPKNRIKSVESIVHTSPLITRAQLGLLFWLKEKTGSSLSTIVNVMAPDKPKKMEWELHQQISASKNNLKNKTELHWFDSNADLTDFLDQKISHSKGTNLVIFPERENVENFTKTLKGKNTISFTGKLSQKQRFLAWQSTYNKNTKTILGTRNALLLPFPDLNQIILAYEEDKTHQRIGQHPDIDTRELAMYLGKEFGTTLIFTTVAPSIETLYKAKTNDWAITRHRAKKLPKINIIDTSEFLKKQQSTLLPQDAIDFIKDEKKPVVLMYNRKGYGALIRCTDCGWEAHCGRCGAYVSSSDQGAKKLQCKRCYQETVMPIQCPVCHNVRLRMQIPGINQLAERIKKMIPEAKLEILAKNEEGEKKPDDAKIILTTLFGIPLIQWDSIGACIMLDTDLSLNFPDYRATEWLLHRVRKIYSLLKSSATLFLLTKHPQNQIFSYLQSNALEPWYEKEIDERKKLHFPPFSAHIGLTAVFSSFEEQTVEEENCITTTKSIIKQNDVTGAVISLTNQEQKIQTHFISLLLVRVPQNQLEKMVRHLEPLQEKGWKVTANPLDANVSDLYT